MSNYEIFLHNLSICIKEFGNLTCDISFDKVNFEVKSIVELSETTHSVIHNAWYVAMKYNDINMLNNLNGLTKLFTKVLGKIDYKNAWMNILVFSNEHKDELHINSYEKPEIISHEEETHIYHTKLEDFMGLKGAFDGEENRDHGIYNVSTTTVDSDDNDRYYTEEEINSDRYLCIVNFLYTLFPNSILRQLPSKEHLAITLSLLKYATSDAETLVDFILSTYLFILPNNLINHEYLFKESYINMLVDNIIWSGVLEE